MVVTCAPTPGLNSAYYFVDFTNVTSTPSDWTVPTWCRVTYNTKGRNNGAELEFLERYDSQQLFSNFYFLFGRAEFVVEAAPGPGIISDMMLLSDDLDEVDWEFRGTLTDEVQTGWFGKGVTGLYNHSITPTIPTPMTQFHTYAYDWTPERVNWEADGIVVRTLEASDCLGTNNQYPQTPMKAMLGLWDAGDPDHYDPWSAGVTPIPPPDGGYSFYVKSVKIWNSNPALCYNWTDHSGSWQSIEAINDTASCGGPTSSSSSAASSNIAVSSTAISSTEYASSNSSAATSSTDVASSTTVSSTENASSTLSTAASSTDAVSPTAIASTENATSTSSAATLSVYAISPTAISSNGNESSISSAAASSSDTISSTAISPTNYAFSTSTAAVSSSSVISSTAISFFEIASPTSSAAASSANSMSLTTISSKGNASSTTPFTLSSAVDSSALTSSAAVSSTNALSSTSSTENAQTASLILLSASSAASSNGSTVPMSSTSIASQASASLLAESSAVVTSPTTSAPSTVSFDTASLSGVSDDGPSLNVLPINISEPSLSPSSTLTSQSISPGSQTEEFAAPEVVPQSYSASQTEAISSNLVPLTSLTESSLLIVSASMVTSSSANQMSLPSVVASSLPLGAFSTVAQGLFTSTKASSASSLQSSLLHPNNGSQSIPSQSSPLTTTGLRPSSPLAANISRHTLPAILSGQHISTKSPLIDLFTKSLGRVDDIIHEAGFKDVVDTSATAGEPLSSDSDDVLSVTSPIGELLTSSALRNAGSVGSSAALLGSIDNYPEMTLSSVCSTSTDSLGRTITAVSSLGSSVQANQRNQEGLATSQRGSAITLDATPIASITAASSPLSSPSAATPVSSSGSQPGTMVQNFMEQQNAIMFSILMSSGTGAAQAATPAQSAGSRTLTTSPLPPSIFPLASTSNSQGSSSPTSMTNGASAIPIAINRGPKENASSSHVSLMISPINASSSRFGLPLNSNVPGIAQTSTHYANVQHGHHHDHLHSVNHTYGGSSPQASVISTAVAKSLPGGPGPNAPPNANTGASPSETAVSAASDVKGSTADSASTALDSSESSATAASGTSVQSSLLQDGVGASTGSKGSSVGAISAAQTSNAPFSNSHAASVGADTGPNGSSIEANSAAQTSNAPSKGSNVPAASGTGTPVQTGVSTGIGSNNSAVGSTSAAQASNTPSKVSNVPATFGANAQGTPEAGVGTGTGSKNSTAWLSPTAQVSNASSYDSPATGVGAGDPSNSSSVVFISAAQASNASSSGSRASGAVGSAGTSVPETFVSEAYSRMSEETVRYALGFTVCCILVVI